MVGGADGCCHCVAGACGPRHGHLLRSLGSLGLMPQASWVGGRAIWVCVNVTWWETTQCHISLDRSPSKQHTLLYRASLGHVVRAVYLCTQTIAKWLSKPMCPFTPLPVTSDSFFLKLHLSRFHLSKFQSSANVSGDCGVAETARNREESWPPWLWRSARALIQDSYKHTCRSGPQGPYA